MANYPKLSIVFPNLEGGPEILELLNSIKNSNYDKKHLEIIMVDNGSKDNSVELVRKNFPKAKIVELQHNLGFSKAVNLGIRKASGEYIFVTNHDIVLEKNCLKTLVSYLQNNPKVGVVGGKTYLKNQPNEIAHTFYKFNFYTGLFKTDKNLDKVVESDWIEGSGMCFPKKLWRKLSGFDEGFFITYEDLDFCLRAKKAGFRIIYNPKAIMWHTEGSTVNKPKYVSKIKYFEGYKSKLRLILKHGNFFQIISSFFLQFAVFAPYRVLVLQEKSFLPLLRAFIWNLKNLSQTLSARRRVAEVRSGEAKARRKIYAI